MFPPAVHELLGRLSALPYENLSKIVAFHHGGGDLRKVEKALDLSSGWLEQARETGAGGTCFSLTWWLARRMGEAGFAASFLLADKGRSRDMHCGLRFDWEGRGWLLDPGYMIFDPLPLPAAGLTAALWSSPNEVILEDIAAGTPPPGGTSRVSGPAAPGSGHEAQASGGAPLATGGARSAVGSAPVASSGRVWRLYSGPRGAAPSGMKWRFDFRQEPATEADFLRAWEASYRFPMMGYPVLNRVKEGTQYYLQKRSLLVRTPQASEMRKLGREEMLEALGGLFGIPEGLAREALEIVLRADQAFFRK